MEFSNISKEFMSGDVDYLLFNNKTDQNSIAILSPHAGYVYSGDIAALSFNSIVDRKYNNVFILSTSHTSNFEGCYVPMDDIYQTPYGDIKINKLVYDTNLITYNNKFFYNDHTIEILLPFIQKGIKFDYIVPIMVGDTNINNLQKISFELEKYFTDDNLFVISSDFSHYPIFDDAIIIDEETKNLILKKNSSDFINEIFKFYKDLSTRMCGWSSYLIFLYLIEKRDDIEIKFLKYKNSSEVFGDKNRTVGYYSISFIKK